MTGYPIGVKDSVVTGEELNIMYGYIYKTTNLVNGKIYIGQHKSTNFDARYYGSGLLLREALKKYGKDNFTIEVIEECASKKELDEKEIYYIYLFDAMNSDIDYNLSLGGTGGDIYIIHYQLIGKK